MTISEMIRNSDKDNMFQVLADSYSQTDFEFASDKEFEKINIEGIRNIIISGLGGSAIGGELLVELLGTKLKYPCIINRNYTLPSYAGKETLFIASSYSGNTIETITSLKAAEIKKCRIICMTTGGEIEKITAGKYPLIKLKPGFQPRFALYNNLFGLIRIFSALKLADMDSNLLNRIKNNMQSRSREYSAESNYALETAEKLLGFIPVVYGVSGITSAAAGRLKAQFNENSKIHSFHNNYPELDHNEIIGWEATSEQLFRPKVITLYDKEYSEEIKKRIEITEELIKISGAEIIRLKGRGNSFEERLLDMVYTCDWISYYLAVLRGKEPIEISNIHILKNRLQ